MSEENDNENDNGAVQPSDLTHAPTDARSALHKAAANISGLGDKFKGLGVPGVVRGFY